jgi:hypothetical protein
MSLTTSAVTVAAAEAAARPSWREEARRDRETRQRLDIERDAARSAARTAELGAADARKAKRAEDRRQARGDAAAARAARLAALGGWANRHVTDLLLAPVIGVPGALSWTAMAAYGTALYGAVGLALPAFSEGGMWAFAAAVTVSRHRHPDRPVWGLQLGIVVFALFGAVLNFIHGLALGGPLAGAAMAVISVAGVTAHQITKAGPRRARRRRTRAERDAVRIARLAARRVREAREEAVKAATVELAADGTARLVYATADTPPNLPRPPKRPAAKPAGKNADTAAAIARLRASKPGISNADIAARLGISPRTVRRYPASTQTSA